MRSSSSGSSSSNGDPDADEATDEGPVLKWKSWVRMESGDIEDEYSPFEQDEDDDDAWWGDW